MSSTILKRALFPRATLTNLTFYSTTTPPPLTTDQTTITTTISILTNHRSTTRWSTLLSNFPNGFTPPQISQILINIRHNPRLAQRFFLFTVTNFQNLKNTHLTLHCCATLIHILSNAHLVNRAKTLINEAINIFEMDEKIPQFFRVLVETYGSCDSSPIVFDLLIRSLLDVNKLDPCVEIVRLLRFRGFSPHVKTCNALIYVACRDKDCFFGYDLYRELFGFNVGCKLLPNVHTFNVLMIAFCRNGSFGMVEKVWVEMNRLGCSPKVCSYGILMGAYCDVGEMVKGRNVWDELRTKGLKPDMVAYNTLIGGYCRVGEIEVSEELYREMGLSGLKGSCVTYQHLINGYCLVGNDDNAVLLCKELCSKGFVPDSSSIDSIVRVICDKKSAFEALEFFQGVTGNTGFVAMGTSYELVIKGLCREGKMEEAVKLQAEMVEKGLRPSSHVYEVFIDGYMKQGKLDVSERLKKEMMATLACRDEP